MKSAYLLACLVGFAALQLPLICAGQTLVVGRSLPLTGPLTGYGEAKRDGGDAYIQQINSAGGIGGKPIELVTLDDAYLPANTVNNLKKIAADKSPVAFLGLFGVPTVAAALPVIEELKIPAVGLTSGADVVRVPFKKFVFAVRASYADESKKLVNHVKTVSITKISVIYSDNPFGESVKTSLISSLNDAGITATAFKVDAAGAQAAEVAKQAAAALPQAIFMTMLSQAAIPVLSEVRKVNFQGPIYTFSPVDTTAVTQKLGKTASGLVISQIVPIPKGLRVKVVGEYLQALKELGRGTPSFYGLEAFIEAKVLVEGLKRAGTKPTPASLVQGLETMKELDVGGFFVSYSASMHAGSSFVEVDVIDAFGEVKR